MQHLLYISLYFTIFIGTFGYSQSNQRAIQKIEDAYAKLRTENIQEGFDEIQELILYFKNNNDTF